MATNLVYNTIEATSKNFLFADHAGDYGPAAANTIDPGTSSDIDFTWSSTFSAGTSHGSDLFDFGASRAMLYGLKACLEWFGTVTAGGTVDFYLAYSTQNNTANGFDGATFMDAENAAGDITNATVAEFATQLHWIGAHVNNGFTGVQIANCAPHGFVPLGRYAKLIAVNNTDAEIAATDDIETAALIWPITPDIQAAA